MSDDNVVDPRAFLLWGNIAGDCSVVPSWKVFSLPSYKKKNPHDLEARTGGG